MSENSGKMNEEPEEVCSSESDQEMESEEEQDMELSDEQKTVLAEEKKAEGNKYYVDKGYPSAISCYSEAISLCPSCAAYYGNRAACYIMMAKYTEALEDARQAVQLDPGFVKGHLREAKCHLVMGEAQAAVVSYEKALHLDPANNIAQTELPQAKQLQTYLSQAEVSFGKQDYRHVVFCMDRSTTLAPACPKYKILKAECLALLKRYQEAQEIANDILRMESGTNPDAIYVRGLCLYYQDNVDKAFQHFQQVLRLAPDHHKARDIYKKAKVLSQKKEEGNQAFRSGRLQEAYDTYTQALAIDPNNIFTNSKIYCNRATVSAKINKLPDAIDDCNQAIKLDDTYLKAYLRRARCYMQTEQYEEAVRDYEKIFKMDKTRENKRLLQDAKLELKKSKRKDFYKILGVEKNATEDEIKKAYRKRALLHHPDRHSNSTEEVKNAEEKKFKEVGEAYSILSDAKKKARYDSGQDMDEMEGAGFHDFDPNMIFQTFFSGGAGGGGPGGYSFSGSGFPPGGFQFQFG